MNEVKTKNTKISFNSLTNYKRCSKCKGSLNALGYCINDNCKPLF